MDLTPLLPGGGNGGARRFAETTVRELARLMPATRFTLLTQFASHESLAALDAPNVERRCVLGASAAAARGGLFAAGSGVLGFLPAFARRAAARAGYAMNGGIKRRGASAALAEARPDLLWCPFTAPALRLPRVPTVSTLYDLQYRAHPEFFTVEDAALRRAATRDALRHATRVAAISRHARDEAIRLEGAEAERIEVIALRLAAGPGAAPAAPRLAVVPGRYLLYPANFWRHKNHERLLRAFALARGRGLAPDLRLVLTGDGGGRDGDLRRLAAGLGIAGEVLFAGYVPDEELAALLAHARALVFPSLYEGFGLPVTEAMAAGIPVACSDAAALPETAGDAALLFDPRDDDRVADALLAIAGDEALRAGLVARGRARAREFQDAPRMAREYAALFGRALAAARAEEAGRG